MNVRRFFVWSILSIIPGWGTCSQCPSLDNESLLLQRDRAYKYRFRSEALAQAVGTTDDQGRVLLECDVLLYQDRPCLHHLHLEGCTMTGDDRSGAPWMDRKPLPGLSQYPVSFSLENGQINVIRFHEEDPLHFVNVKRGVLSAFVFKMAQTQREVRENHTDVQGTCPMTSRPGDEPSTVVTSKDMLHCHLPSRPDWQFSPWSLFWNMSFIQHVINSSVECTYGLDMGRRKLEEVLCRERHAILLESTHRTTTAVQTNVHYHLVFVSEEQAPNPWSGRVLNRKSGIQYEYEDTPEPRSSPSLSTAQKMLSDLVLDSLDEIRLSAIPQFTDLVAWFRSSHDLGPLVDRVSACAFLPQGVSCDQKIKDLAMSFLSDALLQCNSLPCVQALAHLATQGDLSPAYLDVVYQSWSYMHHAQPHFVDNFRNLCENRKSPQCWLSLGSYIQRIYNRATDISLRPYKHMVGKEARELATFFRVRIRENCDPSEEDSKTLPHCLTFLKAAGNMGRYYGRVGGVTELLDVATNENSPAVVRASALETLRDVSEPDDRDERDRTYDQLLPLLKNGSLANSVRILAYDRLVATSEDHYFEEHLLDVLKDENNEEVRHYVASSLDTLMADKDFRAKRWKLFHTLNDLLLENGLTLEGILYESKGKSRSSSNSAFLDLAFLPDSMRRFGLKIRDAFLYDSPLHPSVVSHETVLQLFSALMPTTKLGGYFEGFEELLLAYQKNLQEMDSGAPTASKMYEALMGTLGEIGRNILEEGSLRNFDEARLSNLKKLHQLYWQHHTRKNPFARAYLDLFGSTLKYFMMDNLQSGSVHQALGTLAQKLAEGVTYSRTRVVRLIEAYYQVPTLMGLPLNWTTNATLAFSITAGLKHDATGKNVQVRTNGFLEPSAALTFVNRMVLDFPTVTQIGVQANSSGYTSTQLKAQFDYSEGKQRLRFERPAKTQKVLELFRTNQLIKHDRTEDIEDWDVERVSSSWCSKEDFGLKVCLSKSYPNVTHRLKPWALMAGWCKWQLILHPNNQNAVHYDLELQQSAKEGIRQKQYDAKVSVTEGDEEKATRFRVTMDEEGKARTMELKTSLSPDFRFLLTRNDLTTGKKVSGHKVEANLQLLKDFAYRLEMSSEDKILKSPSQSGSPPDEDSWLKVNEEKVSLTTPYGFYLWNKTSQKLGENVKAEAYASYENLGGDVRWLKSTLPPSFWEDERRASARVRLHWKKPLRGNEGSVTRHTQFRMQIPRYAVTLDVEGLESRHRQQATFHLARKDLNHGKMDAFLNLTLDWWSNEDRRQYSKDIGTVNLTIPRRSWEASFQQIGEGATRFRHEIKLRRALMRPKGVANSDYVGWWSEAVGDRFSVEEQEVKLTADNSWATSSAEALVIQYSTVRAEDLDGLQRHHDVSNHIALTYPCSGRTESLVYDGYLILSGAARSTRYQKNFDLTSSYHNLKLTSHSVYRRESGEGTVLDHSSHLTHLGTDTTAYHTVRYTSKELPGRCYPRTFHHEIRSHVLDLTTDADWTCRQEEEKPLYTLRLTLDTHSSTWDSLDMKIEQVIEDVSGEYSREEMTATHAAGTIHVDAEWHPKHHEKRVVLCSKDGSCPNAELLIEDFSDGRKTVKLALPNRKDTHVTYERTVSADSKRLDVKLSHYDLQDGLSDVLDLTGEILDSHLHVWRGALNASSYAKVADLASSGYAAARGALARVARDEGHPLNKMLRPALKMSLYDYWNGLKTQFREFFATSWSELLEVVYVAETFTEPVYVILVNAVNNVEEWCGTAYKYLKKKTVTVWAIDYFHLPYYLKQGLAHFPHTLKGLVRQLSLGNENVLYFKYVTGNWLSLRSFREFPSLDFFPLLQKVAFFEPKGGPAPPYSRWARRDKLAAIFGVRHVYTFDGLLYDVPPYPQDQPSCTYVLAHDVHRSLFTVLSTRDSVHLLFPEMSLTIDDSNRVYVNGSGQPSEAPIQSNNGKVTVKRSDVVEVWSPSLSVVCRGEDFLCVFRLSEHHRGGVVGLLGNADEYATNDFMLPDGNVSSNFLDFARAYEVSGKAACRTESVPAAATPSDEARRACAESLEGLCPTRSALKEQFVEACASDTVHGLPPCHVTSALAALCHLQHEPTHTDCGASQQKTAHIGRRLEVVLLVQQNKHLSSSVKGMESLVQALDHQFKDKGYERVRFALLGFGGRGVHSTPTFHSVDGDVWLWPDTTLNRGLKSLEFKSRDAADGVQALNYALEELGRDSFDSKVMVAITAKDKTASEKPLMDHLQQQLEANGVALYALSSYPSIEKGRKVYGVRADGLLFGDGGDAYLDFPRGDLAKLAASTRGSAFLVKFLRENEPQAFFSEFAQEVWSRVDKEARRCRTCQSVRGRWWWYRNECRIVSC